MSKVPPTTGREEEAHVMLRGTAIKPWLGWTWVGLFLITVTSVAMLQNVPALRSWLETTLPHPPARTAALPWLPDNGAVSSAPEETGRKRNVVPTAAELKKIEDDLQEDSVVFSALRPEVQAALTSTLGASNAKVYPGLDDWLFYRQEIDYLTGPGFLQPAMLEQRHRAGISQPDPTRSLLHFKNQLERRGIELMLLPIPAKASIYPEKLAHIEVAQPPQNESFNRFLREMAAHDIPVLDPTTALMEAKLFGKKLLFVPTDTHWTPAAIEAVANALATEIELQMDLPWTRRVEYSRVTRECEAPDDLVRQLGLPKEQKLYPLLHLPYHQVLTPQGKPCTFSKSADVLILGDSYCGMFEPAGAGLVQQLSYAMKRPVDRIALPNGGSYSARAALRKQLLIGDDRLAGKRLVIWQFNVRDFIMGDWRTVDLPQVVTTTPTKPGPTFSSVAFTPGTMASPKPQPSGTAISPTPAASSTPGARTKSVVEATPEPSPSPTMRATRIHSLQATATLPSRRPPWHRPTRTMSPQEAAAALTVEE